MDPGQFSDTVYERSLSHAGMVTSALVGAPEGKRLFLSCPAPGFFGAKQPQGGVVCPLS